ncbi:MAG TPA: hypothetical protein VFC63_14800 [Blastocatellia bacterium]|nr:hypothetical protein [Blastocatellia bacterium]
MADNEVIAGLEDLSSSYSDWDYIADYGRDPAFNGNPFNRSPGDNDDVLEEMNKAILEEATLWSEVKVAVAEGKPTPGSSLIPKITRSI